MVNARTRRSRINSTSGPRSAVESSRRADTAHESPELGQESGDNFIARERNGTSAGLTTDERFDELERRLTKLEESQRQRKEFLRQLKELVERIASNIETAKLDLNVFNG
ncbi:MAG: hypothetical protein Q9212_004533, partial [Teloschistes hypoglaucus]